MRYIWKSSSIWRFLFQLCDFVFFIVHGLLSMTEHQNSELQQTQIQMYNAVR